MTLDEFDPQLVAKFCRTLYTAFGVGCENAGPVELPKSFSEPLDAARLLEEAPSVRVYADDKRLYLTTRKLKDRELPSGRAPTQGYSEYGKDRAVISTFGMKDLEASLKLVGRHALHQLGHIWEVHHCLDPRCALYPPWTPSFAQGEPSFCTFCRDRSDQKIRLEKS
jgi:predicted Zn-dependent protease